MNFDLYYSISNNTPTPLRKYFSNVVATEPSPNKRGTPSENQWTLWTLRDPSLLGACGTRQVNKLCPDQVWIAETKRNFLTALSNSGSSLIAGFPTIPHNAIVIKGRPGRVYKSDKILTYGETYIYSAFSDVITIEGYEVGFQSFGKCENKMVSGLIKLRGTGGLAQILAACVQTDDIFVIVGRDIDGGDEVAHLMLNGTQESSEQLTMIRLPNDMPDVANMSLLERVSVHTWPGYYDFKYACCDTRTGFKIQTNRYRTFTFQDGPQELHDNCDPEDAFTVIANFPMPIVRDVQILPICRRLLSYRSDPVVMRRSTSMSPQTTSGYSSATTASPCETLQLSPREPDFDNERFRRLRQRSCRGPKAERSRWEKAEDIWIPMVKTFCVVVLPMLVLLVFFKCFLPAPPKCVNDPTVSSVAGATTTPSSLDYSYNNYNYEDAMLGYEDF